MAVAISYCPELTVISRVLVRNPFPCIVNDWLDDAVPALVEKAESVVGEGELMLGEGEVTTPLSKTAPG